MLASPSVINIHLLIEADKPILPCPDMCKGMSIHPAWRLAAAPAFIPLGGLS